MDVRQIKFWFLTIALLLQLTPGKLVAQTAPSEYQLKAAFVYNFAKFSDWPVDAFTSDNAPFVIGILGDDPFGNDLAKIVSGKQINSHPIVIRPFRDADQIAQCHLLFVGRSEVGRLSDILQRVRGAPILTVSETDQFIQAGGMIKFVEESQKVRFQINESAAKTARLKMSSKLLSLAVTPDR